MEFVYWAGIGHGYKHSTLHVCLYALRFAHLVADGRDILKDKLRLKMAMAGLKRRQKSPKRKHPVTVAHIKQIQLGLDTGLWDDLLLLTAVSFGFSFLLRACEYLSKDGVVHEDKVLRMEHLHIFQAGHKLGWEQIMAADELVIHVPGSKTDIYNDGYKLNIKLRAGDTPSDINPLCLLRQLYTMNPARFGANGSKRPVFCLACGRVLERSTVNTALKAAAVALGLDPADHATHSLRAGGATALYAIGWPPSKIQRRGRWLSDCWLLYIWPDREEATGLMEDVVSSPAPLFHI